MEEKPDKEVLLYKMATGDELPVKADVRPVILCHINGVFSCGMNYLVEQLSASGTPRPRIGFGVKPGESSTRPCAKL